MTLNTKQNRYDLMSSQEIEGDSKNYPDCLSINLDDFRIMSPPKEALIRQNDTFRPDIFFYRKRGTNNLEDIILWINDISSRRDMIIGSVIKLPSVNDSNSYFIKNRKTD